MTPLACPATFALSVVLIAAMATPASAQAVTERREAAVLQARAGHPGAAIRTLRAMLAAHEDDGLVAMDLATLLQQADRAAEAVAVFEGAALAEPPDYALLAVTRAYRDLKRYAAAERLAREGTRRFPDQPVWPVLLSLVLTDAGRPKEALAVLAGPGGAHARPFERLMAEGYAWRRAGDLAKAKAAYTQALGLPHDSIEPETGLAEIALEQNHYAEASRIARAALDARPQDLQARRFARDIHAAEGWILDTQVKPSDSEGGGANAANGAIAAHVGLSSPPVEDNWRFFVAGDYADAHPPEGFVDRARVEAGAVWATPVVSASLYGGQNWGSLTKASGGATVDWSPTSRIHVGLAAEFYSWDTPLRALPHDIWADEYSARITWRWSDADSVSAGFAYLPFTDGNRRYGESITLSHRLYSGPDLDLTGTAEVYVSQNNRPQAPYYNPDHDLTADVGFTAAQRLWRRGDTILTQVLLVNAGVYAEAHFPADVIATTRYEHRWRFDPWMEVDYGVELSRRVYDGSPETTVALVAGLRRRF